MMDEFVIMNVEDYQGICDAVRSVTNSEDTFTIDGVIDVIDGLISGEMEDAFITRTLTSYTDEEATSVRAYLFTNMVNLTDVYFPNVTTLNTYAFFGSGLKKATPENFPKVKTLTGSVFRTSKVTEVDFPLVTGSTSDLYGCKQLVRANFPNATTLSSLNLCSALTELNAPLVKSVGGNVLRGCSVLPKVDFHAVTSFGNFAMADSPKLVTVIIRTPTVATLSNTNALGNQFKTGAGYIYVPASLVETYKSATNWSTFAEHIRAIEDYPEITGGTV